MLVLLRIFRKQVRQWAYNLRAKLRIKSLKVAIKEADDNKKKTNRKTMVVFNSASGKYEPIEKRVIKIAHKVNKNKNNAALTDGRRWWLTKNKKKKSEFTYERVKQIEKKSLYVTD